MIFKIFFLTFSILILILENVSGQKYDNTWMMGCCYTPISRLNGGINLRFDHENPDTFYLARKSSFDKTSISVSDPITGDLLFYSNGCHIYNKLDSIMQFGQNINSGQIHDDWCLPGYGYIMPKGGVIIPNSENSQKYYVIHRAYDDLGETTDRLYYSEVDLSFNQGLGRVIKKNIPLLKQKLYRGQFDITKHANGIDFWIFAFNYNSDTIYRFLVDKNGINGPMNQFFPITRERYDQRANSTISPDGKIAARIDPVNGLFLMDIDRETGLFSNLKQYPYWSSIDSSNVTSVAFSPNGKFLYVSNRWRLYQFDVKSPDFEKSRILIDTFDLFHDPYSTAFYLMQLAPNGKIYMNCTNGVKYLHTIHKPNERGKACDFRQHDFILPTQNVYTMPYFPNYRLGPVTSFDDVNKDFSITIYPNPVRDRLTIMSSINAPFVYSITDVMGKSIMKDPYKEFINTSTLCSGIYILKIRNQNEHYSSIKFVKY